MDEGGWCLMENEMIILRRTKRAIVRLMRGVKLVDGKNRLLIVTDK